MGKLDRFDKGYNFYIGVKKSIVSVVETSNGYHLQLAHRYNSVHVNDNCLTFQIQSSGPIQPRLSNPDLLG